MDDDEEDEDQMMRELDGLEDEDAEAAKIYIEQIKASIEEEKKLAI